MRLMPGLLVMVTSFVPACGSSRSETMPVAPKPMDVSRPPASPGASVEAIPTFEVLRADTPRTTTQGISFVAPKDWKIAVRGAATLLELPEAGSRMALVDVNAKDADAVAERTVAPFGECFASVRAHVRAGEREP